MPTIKINRIIIVFCFLFMVLVRLNAETLAVILQVKGSVTVTKEGQSESIKLKRGARLENGDKLITGKDGYTAMRFIDDASLVRVNPNSICIIKGEKKNNEISKNIFVETGAILAKITKQKGKFQVATPTSVASVKGTTFITDHRNNVGTYYHGEDGLVEISNDVGSALLRVGQTIFVASATTGIVILPPGEWKKPDFLIGTDSSTDSFEMDFEDESGKKQTLKFKVKKNK